MGSLSRAVASLLLALPAAAAFIASPPLILTRNPVRLFDAVLSDCGGQGFNAFRRWPHASTVSLTNEARSFFGLDGTSQNQLTFDEMRDLNKCSEGTLDQIFNSMPLPDQRGERVMLDVDGQGQLQWRTFA